MDAAIRHVPYSPAHPEVLEVGHLGRLPVCVRMVPFMPGVWRVVHLLQYALN